MSNKIESTGYRILGVIEPRSFHWKDLVVGKQQRNTELRGLLSDKKAKKDRFSPKSILIEESETPLSEDADKISAAMDYIHSNKNDASQSVKVFYDKLKSVKDEIKSIYKPGDVISNKDVEYINDMMNAHSPGDLVKLKIQITRVEDNPFPGSRKLDNGLYTKTRVQATIYFNSLEEATDYIKSDVISEALSGAEVEVNSYDSIVVLDQDQNGRVVFKNQKIDSKEGKATSSSLSMTREKKSILDDLDNLENEIKGSDRPPDKDGEGTGESHKFS